MRLPIDANLPVAVYYAAAFLAALTIAFVFTPVAMKVAIRRSLLDEPRGYRTQPAAVPYLGGIVMVVTFALVVTVGALFRPLQTFPRELPVIMSAALCLAIVGLVDDLRHAPIWIRFVVQVGAAVALFFTGVRTDIFGGGDAINLVITVLWIVGITNAFNLLDNMDGLSAGVAVIASLFFFFSAALYGQILVASLAIALAGCAVGFLRHNVHPAKIYMGDAGSLFIGFVLAVIGLKLRFPAPPEVAYLVPILILWIPIFDTTLVVATRLAHRLSPYSGNRDHLSHRLVFMGLSVPMVVRLIYVSAVGVGWLAICVSRTDVVTGYMLAALVIGSSLVIGSLLARVPVYENSKRRRMMLVEVKKHEPEQDVDSVQSGSEVDERG